ncbi:hypothetical protein [Patulibacter americanus]|uniref:hypothetical protein n=1 Tax=Patulibacter americanus TaxID=588672 RepID=UPI0003B587E2|nr:hypothetical protein [Patulibacter americanus]
MRPRHTAAGALAIATLALGAGVPTAGAATKDCGTIQARGERLSVHVTYGSFGCANARGLFRAYFAKVDPRSTPRGTRYLRRAGKRFGCYAAVTGSFDFICAGTKRYRPTIAVDRL